MPEPNADLTGCDLSGQNLATVDLSGSNLTAVDLTNTDLSHADLTGAKLVATTLNGTNLMNAELSGVSSARCSGTPEYLPIHWQLAKGYLVGQGAVLTDAQLSGVDLSNGMLSGADFSGADLSQSNLADTDLSGADLDRAHLEDADLSFAGLGSANLEGAGLADAKLDGVSSGGIVGTPSTLPVDWRLVQGYLVGRGAQLANADLAGADLSGATLTATNLAGAELSGSAMTGVRSGGIASNEQPANLPASWQFVNGYLVGPGADLQNADLHETELPNVPLVGANLAGANLVRANLSGAYLSDANVEGADFSEADLTGVRSTGLGSGRIRGMPKHLPPGWTLSNGQLLGPGPDDCDLQYVCTTGIHQWAPAGGPDASPQWGSDDSKWVHKVCTTVQSAWEVYCGLLTPSAGMGTIRVRNDTTFPVEVSDYLAGSFPDNSQVGMVILKPGEDRCFDIAGPMKGAPGYHIDLGYINWVTRDAGIGHLEVTGRTTSGGGCGSNGLNMASEPPDVNDHHESPQWGGHDNPDVGATCSTSDDRTQPNGADSLCGGVQSLDEYYTITTGAVRLQNEASPDCGACQVRIAAYMPGNVIQGGTVNGPVYFQTSFFGIGSYVLAPGEEACFAFKGRTNELQWLAHYITIQRPAFAPSVETKVTGIATSGTNCGPNGLNMTVHGPE